MHNSSSASNFMAMADVTEQDEKEFRETLSTVFDDGKADSFKYLLIIVRVYFGFFQVFIFILFSQWVSYIFLHVIVYTYTKEIGREIE